MTSHESVCVPNCFGYYVENNFTKTSSCVQKCDDGSTSFMSEISLATEKVC